MRDVVIIGAGIAGLSAAWELRTRGQAPLIVEASPRAGGVIRTDRVDGFVIDAGPDSILVHKSAGLDLCRELGLAERLHPTLPPRTAFVLKHGRLVPLPESSFLGLPTRVKPFLTTRLFSWRAKLRMALETLTPARHAAGDESIGQFMRRRFGDEAVTFLAEPLLAGIHAGDVEQLSIGALFPALVDAERTRGSVLRALFATRRPTSAQGAFVSFPGGTIELVNRLADALDEGAIYYNAGVESIGGRAPFALALTTGETIETKAVIVTAPAWAAASILRGLDAELSNLCASIPYASTATVAFGLARDQVAHPLRGTGFVVPRSEGRQVMAGTWVSSKWPHRAPDGHVLVRAFLGGAQITDLLSKSDDELAAIAFGELASILDIAGAPVLTRVFRWPRATPQYHVGHLDTVRRIDERLAHLPGLFVCGSGYRGTGIPDCIADARASAARASAGLR